MFAPLTVQEIVALDAQAAFAKLGLREHLTQQRSNGLASMIARIKKDASQAAGGGIAAPMQVGGARAGRATPQIARTAQVAARIRSSLGSTIAV